MKDNSKLLKFKASSLFISGSLFCIGSVLIASWIALDHLWITVATSFSHISLAKIRIQPSHFAFSLVSISSIVGIVPSTFSG